MNTSNGWIKLNRCLLDDPIWQCSTNEQKIILVTLLLMANHAERKWEWKGRPYQCQPGQMITSLASIRDKVGKRISLFQIRHAIKRFETMGFLVNKSSKTGRLITICNWDAYQSKDQSCHNDDVQNTSIWPQDSRMNVTPNKNVKNEKNTKTYGCDFLTQEALKIRRADGHFEEAKARFLAEAEKAERTNLQTLS